MGLISIEPIGVVHSDYSDPGVVPLEGHQAVVEVFPQYADGLYRIEEHSHLWILSWFHKARRDYLRTVPARVNPDLPQYGVFGLRAAGRPNPIAISLVRLVEVKGNKLHVLDLDALGGSPVLDIKPYFENDVVFSPMAPYFRPKKETMRYNLLHKRAYRHHQEDCDGLLLALRIAMIAEEYFGRLNYPDLKLAVEGAPCLADTLQGLFNARLANPPRFSYKESGDALIRLWDGSQELIISQKDDPTTEELKDLGQCDFLEIVKK